MYSDWPHYNQKIINQVSSVIKTGNLNIWKGKFNIALEKKFSKYTKTKYALSVATGSIALDIALKAIGIKKNDEVIVTSKSYFISAACVLNLDAIPKFADVDYDTQNISIDSIKKNISKKTRAIICVHLGGLPCNMEELIKICKSNNIKLIEDCAQAHGAKYNNIPVGSFGDISCWSFCNDKIISCGEGGMIVTNNLNLWKRAWSFREGGRNIDAIKKQKNKIGFKFIHETLGLNSRMTEIQSIICLEQLKELDQNIKKRISNANKIKKILNKYKFINIPESKKKYYNSYYRLYVKVENNVDKSNPKFRNLLLKKLISKGIPCEEGSCSEIYLEKPFKSFRVKRKPNAKKTSINSIAFKVHHTLKRYEINDICKSIDIVLKKINRNL